jgi:hypothetical protein
MSLIAMLFGLAATFSGYRIFLVLLPIFGFVFGFGLGAQTLQVLFGEAFLATVTSWVVGFVVGAVFAVLSYLIFLVGVAIIAGALGYSLAVGLMGAIGFDLDLLVWVVGIVAAIVLAFVTLKYNIQKWVIIAFTAFGGAAVIIVSILGAFGKLGPLDMAGNPAQQAIQDSVLWLIFFLVVGIAGAAVQVRSTMTYEFVPPENRI